MNDIAYLGFKDIQKYLGISRNRLLELCRTKPNSFPVIKIGNKYQADQKMLEEWRVKLYKGDFKI